MASKRVVIVTGSFPDIPCGISPYVKRIAEGLARRDEYDLHVLTSADPAVNNLAGGRYQVHPSVGKWGVVHARRICREILKLKPEIVHIQNPTIKYAGLSSLTMSAVVPLLKKMAPSVRVVVMQHDIAVSQPILRWRYKPLLCSADAVLISNNRDYQAVIDIGVSASHIYQAPMSSYVKLHKSSGFVKAKARQSMGIPPDAVCVAFFGFVLPGRNIHILIQALAELGRDKPEIHGLILGGPHKGCPKYFAVCRKLAEKLQLDKHITWTGFASVDQIADGLASADVFVSLPERGADMRNTSIITAMLADLPIVTSHNQRFYIDPELESLGCVCVNPNDSSAVSNAIVKALLEPPSQQFLNQRSHWLDPYKIWNQHVEIIMRAYNQQKPLPASSFAFQHNDIHI